MPATLSERHLLNLERVGDSVTVWVAEVPELAVRALDHETWDNAVVTIRKVYGGESEDFSPAATVDKASPTLEGLDIAGVLQVKATVTTAGTAGTGFGRIGFYGKETQ